MAYTDRIVVETNELYTDSSSFKVNIIPNAFCFNGILSNTYRMSQTCLFPTLHSSPFELVHNKYRASRNICMTSAVVFLLTYFTAYHQMVVWHWFGVGVMVRGGGLKNKYPWSGTSFLRYWYNTTNSTNWRSFSLLCYQIWQFFPWRVVRYFVYNWDKYEAF